MFWYLSFASNDDFLGACVVQGRDVAEAAREAHRLGINPGGEVLGLPVPPGPCRFPVNRLLSRAELEAASPDMIRLGDTTDIDHDGLPCVDERDNAAERKGRK